MLKKEDVPRWVGEKQGCLFCYKLADPSSIEVRDKDIAVGYICENPECGYFRFGCSNGEKYTLTIIYHGFSEHYKKFLTKPKEPGFSSSLKPEIET